MNFLEELGAAHSALTEDLKGQTLSGADESQIIGVGRESEGLPPRLIVYLNGVVQEKAVRDLVASLGGTPVARRHDFPLQIIRPTPVKLLSGSGAAHGHHQRPLCAGVAIGCRVHKRMGTVGFFVNSKGSSALYFLSCRHIFGGLDEPVLGREIYQPPQQGGKIRPIGKIVRDGLSLNPWADFVLIECYEPHRPHMFFRRGSKRKYIKYSASVNNNPRFNQPVKKSGAKSGFSNGRVVSKTTLKIPYPLANGSVRVETVSDLTEISTYWSAGLGFFAGPGDSGAPIVTHWAKHAVGMLLGAYSYESDNGETLNHYLAQPLDKVMNQWNLSIRNF
jgi:hypothetical protein